MRARRLVHVAAIGASFFLSGAAALAYQVAWQRLLALQTGVGLWSIAVIVAAFMVGLGAGSRAGAALTRRLSPRQALVAFALCELAIAAFGAASRHLYYDWLYLRWGALLFAEPVPAAIVQMASLAVPTVLMGMSLPLLARATVRDAATASRSIGLLYGVNVLGAAAGALATPWVFIRHFGIESALHAAAAANLAAGVLALALGVSTDIAAGEATAAPVAAPRAHEPARPLATWIALYALSGFCALALEILWFRVMDVAVKATAYTFGTVLALYLLGSAVGALAGTVLAPRVARPYRTYLVLQCLLLAYAGLALTVVARLPPATPGYAWYYEVWSGQRSFNLGGAMHWDALLRLYVVLPLVLFGPATVLMGFSFPILQRAVQDDPQTSGWKTGVLQAANIAGCVGGSLAVGIGALTLLGTPGTMRLLLLLGLVFAGIGLRSHGGRSVFGPLAATLVLVAAVVPGQREFWMPLHGTTSAATLLAEDATGVSAIIPDREQARLWRVWSGGRMHSSLPFSGIHTTLGAAPAVVHPAPRAVAIIGLGSGDTAASAGCRRDVEQRITVFEIHAPQPRLLRAVAGTDEELRRLGRFLADERYEVRIADGRSALDRGRDRYDLIEADALWPTSPYAGNLYSVEFFALCARKLQPGGLVTTWAPSERVRASFLAVFPHTIEVAGGTVLIGGLSPIPIAPEEWRRRLYDAGTVRSLGQARADSVWADLARAQPATASAAPVGTNQDLFPRDEFHSPD